MSEIRPLEVTWGACERMVTDILDEAKIPAVPGEPDDAQMAARLHWLADDWTRLRAEVERLTKERDEARESRDGWHARACGDAREIARLRGALRKAKGPITVAASYADAAGLTVGMRVHARDCARILPKIRAALADADKEAGFASLQDVADVLRDAALAGEAGGEREAEPEPKAGTCCTCGESAGEQEGCPARTDETHCVHWWDGEDTPEKASQP